MTSSTSVGVTATQTQTPVSGNGSFDVGSGASKEITSYGASQHASSRAGMKAADKTKQGGGSGILARGQKLFKQLANTNDRRGK